MKRKKLILIIIFIVVLTLSVVLIVSNNVNNTTNNEGYSFELGVDTTGNDAKNTVKSDYYVSQKELKEEYLDDLNNNVYTLDNPKIIVNPWDFNVLSAYIAFENEEPVKYSYTVLGNNSEQNFEYTSQEDYKNKIIIPVTGLYYGENTVTVSLENSSGNKETIDYIIDTSVDTTIDEDMLNIDVTSYNEDSKNLLDNSFIFSAKFNGYDTNGELRFFIINGRNQYFKYSNDSFYIVDGDGPADYMYKMDAMGQIKTEYYVSEEYVIHHDSTTDNDGNLYILTSPNSVIDDSGTQVEGEENIVETTIEKFDDETGEFIEMFDFYDYFIDNPVVASGIEFDPLHINSVEYDEINDSLILSSQAQGMVFSVSANDYTLNWVIDEEEDVVSGSEELLEVISDNFIYTSGQHSAMINYNAKYDSYREEGKNIVTVYNNNVCKNEDGEEYKTDQENGPFGKREGCAYLYDETNPFEYDKSEIVIYAIDEENKIVEMIDDFELPVKSPIVSNVWTFNGDTDYYDVFSGSAEVPTYYLLDSDGEIIFEANFPVVDGAGLRPSNYRGRAITGDMLINSINR